MEPGRRRELVFLALAAAACGTLPLLFPADAPWIRDEPALLMAAWNVVHGAGIPSHGLTGSVGLPYGPAPILIFSAALVVTHNLVLLVFLRALFFSLALGVSVWWLARMCPALSPPVGVLAMLSPYYWYFGRVLWDNSFVIPFSALTLVIYISFCRTQAAWKLWLVALGTVLMFETHLMCLPLLAALVCHFAWQHGAWARKHAGQCLATAAAGLAACLPYLLYLTRHVSLTEDSSAAATAASPISRVGAWFFPLLGGKTFSALGLGYFFGEKWQNSGPFPALLWALTVISALSLLAFWIGCVVAARLLLRNHRAAGDKPIEFHLWSIVLLTLILQMLMSGVVGTDDHPHYYNATSFCAFTLLWLAYSEVRNRRWRWTWAGLHAASLLAILLVVIARVHQTQGNRSIHYGPTLGTQLEVVRELDFQNSQTVVFAEASNYCLFPEAFAALETFYPPHYSAKAPVRRLVVRYADAHSGAGRLIVSAAGPAPDDRQMTRLR